LLIPTTSLLQAKGEVRVLNNGAGVPVEVHKTEGIYVPELIFGQLLTSSNYNDQEKKVTGGRNGYGAKLANIFSTKFVVETCDGKRKRRYKQVFKQNMTAKGAPQITDCKATENWTCISFQPDLERFGMEELEEDTVALMRKRVYDMAGILGKGVKVYYNGSRIPVKDFQSYVDLYLGPKAGEGAVPRVYEKFGDRWEVCIAASDGQPNQVSFANAICTSKGGTHVNYIADQVVKNIVEVMAKKHKQAGVKPFMVRNYLWVFVNCLVENPAFDSQTKDTLTLRASAFGSKCELSDPYLKKVANCGIIDAVLSFASFKANKELKKGDGAKKTRLVGIPKLDDANDAGGKNSDRCTLILTEGDSAKSLAISGLSVVGRDRYGVFPLRGKLLNVRDAAASQITGNAEINHIKQILGLQHGKNYTDTKSLRYGHLMIMTDQDHDGSHIKGLIMNFFHTFYPSLLTLPGFLVEFITPIIKATKGKESISFFTMPEYENWREEGNRRGWKIKYYKGLGTSTAGEAKDYFSNIESHRKEFVWQGPNDGTALEMAFSKKKIDERKDWLRSFVPGTFLDHSADTISYHEFVHKELILFSRADLERSIPSMIDGFKPGQRKIMYACFKRNLRNDIKVAQLAGYVAEHSAYHHGEASLTSTVMGLAQDFTGSNNINYLVPQGQFGTRLQGGKDAASPRYVFTRLANLTRHLFNESDDKLLRYLNEEGQSIEPEWYVPILPAVLINGAEGIGTGWSTSIPNYNPRDIVDNIKCLLNNEEMFAMDPWYRGYQGSIEEVVSNKGVRSYVVHGVINQIDATTLEIIELPIRKWTQDYKEFLEDLARPEDKNSTPFITEYREYHTDSTVRFVVTLTEAKMKEALAIGLHTKFKLTSKIAISNMMLFGADGIIRRYEGPEDIIREFYPLRMEYYIKRKAALLRAAEAELTRISNRVRFILAVVDGSLKISNRRRADIEVDLEKAGFDRLLSAKKASAAAAAGIPELAEDEEGAEPEQGSYEYLLSMSLSSLTLEKVQALKAESDEKEAEVAGLRGTTEAEMWRRDLDGFLAAYEEFEEEEARKEMALFRQQAKARKADSKRVKAAKAKKNSKKKKADWSDDESELCDSDMSDEDDFIPVKRAAQAAKPRRPAPAHRAPISEPSSMTSSTAAGGSKKGTAKGAVAAAASREPSPPPVEEEMSLMQRMAMRMNGMDLDSKGSEMSVNLDLPAAPKLSKPPAAAKKAPAAAKPRPARAAVKKPIRIYDSDEESEEESDYMDDSEEEEFRITISDGDSDTNSPVRAPKAVPKPTAVAAKAKSAALKKAPAAAAKPKAKKVADSSDEEEDAFEILSDEENSPAPVVAKPKAAPRRAAAPKAKYVEDSDEEESEEESEPESDYCPSD
jgi:DNA topoisomerase-2